MSLLTALWLLVVHAIAVTPARTSAEPREVAAVDAARSDDALPAAHAPAALAAARGHSPPARPTLSTPLAPHLRVETDAYAIVARARTPRASHATAARGAVTPYFATAPPLRA